MEIVSSIVASKYMRGDHFGSQRDCLGINFDTRILNSGEIFFALKSPENDGHAYIDSAINKQASCIVYSDEGSIVGLKENTKIAWIKVEDTFQGLIDFSEAYRQQFPTTVVGITGSAGKTSTRDLTALA